MLDGLPTATELYFDSISRVHVDRWSQGRLVLLGDAGYGATFGALGTGTAVVGAYVLAGELARAGNDHRIAFEQYEARLRKAVSATQDGSRAGQFLAPSTRFGITARNRMLDTRFFLNQMLKMAQKMSNLIELPDYDSGRQDSAQQGELVQE